LAVLTEEEFAEQIRSYMVNMYRLSFAILNSTQDAEDAVGEAVLRAFENRNALKKKDAFKAWIMQITANEAKKIYRKNKRTYATEWEEQFSPAFYDDYHELWDAVMQLDNEFRDVIVLFYYEQFSIKDISKIMKCKEGTVKSRIFRAKNQLRELLTESL